jgi:FixJ family two-component response regulator
MMKTAIDHPPKKQSDREIFILDDEASAREALRVILQQAEYNVICFADELALLEMTRRRCPSCIFLDVKLPGRSGLEILKDLADYPAPIIMVSGHGDIPMAVNAIKGGAVDFIQKPFRAKEIVSQLEGIVTGFSFRNRKDVLGENFSLFPGKEPLTRRGRQVLQLLTSGLSNKEAGRTLGISPRTAQDHRANIMRKLEVKSTTEL